MAKNQLMNSDPSHINMKSRVFEVFFQTKVFKAFFSRNGYMEKKSF